ncbi:MAG: GHKL domain-containing protein [Anaerocolumna sp.]
MSDQSINFLGSLIMLMLMSGLSLLILYEYFRMFLKKHRNTGINWIIWIIYFAWQIIATMKNIDLAVVNRVLLNILLVFLVAFNFNGSAIHKFIFTVIYNSVWMLIEFLVGYIFISLGMDYGSWKLMGSLLSKIMLLLVVNSLQRFFNNYNIQNLPNYYEMLLMLIPMGSMFVVYNSFMMSSQSYKRKNILCSFVSLIIMLIINILIFYIYLKLSEALELRNKNEVYKHEMELYSRYIDEKENTMLRFRKARHDLKNQLVYLLGLLEEKKYDELNSYLSKLIEREPFDRLNIANSNNLVVDAIVNYEYGIARRNGIEFQVKLEVPIKLNVDSTDLCIILGNALDNAIEANIKLNSKKPYIKLLIKLDRNNLIIIVENSFDGIIKTNAQGKILTMKEDIVNHGIGINSIQKTVDKYHGFSKINIVDRDKIFVLKIVLYLY